MGRSAIAWLTARLQVVRTNYLLLPGAVALALAVLGGVLTAIDTAVGGRHGALVVFPGGPEAARTVLTTIAASLITVAGVAFSITIVTLQLVSQQFTPRAVRTFLADRVNQTIAGVFIGLFLYCLVALRSVRSGAIDFVPGLAVTTSIGLAVVALALLLVFIHHMGHSIDVSNIAARVAQGTLAVVDKLYPESYGEDEEPADEEALAEEWRAELGEPIPIPAQRAGYVQSIDDLPHTVSGSAFRLRLFVQPGDFVTANHPLGEVWTEAGEECARAVARGIAISNERDLHQDAGYGVRQLTDIAIKALSPSVNDPTTAVTCIGYLQEILERLAQRRWPSNVRRFEEQDVVAFMRTMSFEAYLDAYVQIARYAEDGRVVEALFSALLRVAEAAADAGAVDRVESVVEVADRIASRTAEHLDEHERREVAAVLDDLGGVARGVGAAAPVEA